MLLASVHSTLSHIRGSTTLNGNPVRRLSQSPITVSPQMVQTSHALSPQPLHTHNTPELSSSSINQYSSSLSPPTVPITTSVSLLSSPHILPPCSAPAQAPIVSSHPMTTRSRNGIFKPKIFQTSYYLAESDPTTAKQALQDPKWVQAMKEEFATLQSNQTWSLVPFRSDMNVVGCKWVFRTKFRQDGSLLKYKARLVAKGFHQTPGLDFLDTFSPVVKASIIRVIFSIAVSYGWLIEQIDIVDGDFW
ncbi:hypothetical protein LWI29_022178 [Acer saccharum]|uniref:Reverse transcriptase Ty1/copia-type domain-containing protein n=1 Tax=Acer saccharum TaxID=4024 RepID=A0AA39SPV6_ACESA|nr:hypothetical protein LWI29_022178 [Acer saccharum]